MCCSRAARAQVRAPAATKTGGLGPFSQPTVGTTLSPNHPLSQPLTQDKKPAPAAGSDLKPTLRSAPQSFKKLAVANGRRAERQWRRRPPMCRRNSHASVANGRRAERQWRLFIPATVQMPLSWSPTGDAPKGNGDLPLGGLTNNRTPLSPTGDAPKGNGDKDCFVELIYAAQGRQRATRRKAMETRTDFNSIFVFIASPTGDAPKGNGDPDPRLVTGGAINPVANGRRAERQWRQRCRIAMGR